MLKRQFKRSGFTFELIWNDDKFAIYKASKNHFEVMRYSRHKKDVVINGKLVFNAGDIKYPGTSEWGTNAYTTTTEKRAHEVVERMKR